MKRQPESTSIAHGFSDSNQRIKLNESELKNSEKDRLSYRVCSYDVTAAMLEEYSFGDLTLFLCKFLLLFHYATLASGHMSEHTLLAPLDSPAMDYTKPTKRELFLEKINLAS